MVGNDDRVGAQQSPVEALVNTVIVYQGPGSWKREAHWDEYVVTIANRGDAPLVIDSFSLTGLSGREVAPGTIPWALEKQSRTLEQEGFDDLGSGRLVESFARHFMVVVDAWQEQGFGSIAKNYLARLAPESGVRRDIAENGDLLVRRVAARESEAERRSLLRALAEPSWLDPATGGPRG